MNVVRKSDVEKDQENIIQTLNPTKKVRDLEKKLKFSETFENKVALADVYMENGMFEKAIEHYNSSLVDMFKNDYYVLSRIQEAYFGLNDMDLSLKTAEKINDNKKFLKSNANFLYAKALERKGDLDLAEEQFRSFDAPYNYYHQRLEFAKFLMRVQKDDEAKQLLQEIANESESMSRQSYRANRLTIKLVKEELAKLT